MPFKSFAQQKFLYANEPEVAKEFSTHTPKNSFKKLPEYASSDKTGLKALNKKYRRSNNGQKI